ncbi:MAG: M28 family peptidase [Deltaproteobacteria bacterium]|nr:M28 family peptidase [Candidatus Zymogenaceae bacterium]
MDINFTEIMETISIPRPGHRETLEQTAVYIKEVLTSWNIPFTVQEFMLRPYMQFSIGLTLLILAVLLFILVWRKKPTAALIVSIIFLPLLLLEFEMFIPLVSRILTKPAENIIITFSTPDAVRELIFAAHYDSKTDFFDHIQRAKIYKWIPYAFLLGVVLSVWLFFVKKSKKALVTVISLSVAGLLVVYWGLVFIGFGGFVFMSPEKDSLGTIDDGASFVTLMALAKNINDGEVDIGDSNVTIILTCGEETTLQGADFYVKERWGKTANPELPTSLVNLELIGQNGNMIYWPRVGVFLKFYDADPELIERASLAWEEVSGVPMTLEDESITDDSHRFAAAGIPVITIGHEGRPGLGMGGFHSTADNLERLNYENLEMAVETLGVFIESYDSIQ